MYPGIIDQTYLMSGHPNTTSPYYYRIVTAGTSPNKGSWSTSLTSPAVDCVPVLVISGAANTGLNLVNVGMGSTPAIIVENLIYETVTTSGHRLQWVAALPIRIPPSTPVSLQSSSTTTGRSLYYHINWIRYDTMDSSHPYEKSITYGADETNTRGVVIDAGSTAYTKPSSFTEIVSAANNTVDTKGFMFSIGSGDASMASSNEHFHCDIAVGAASSEQIIISDMPIHRYSGCDNTYPAITPFFPICIPAGTRISARASSNSNTAALRVFSLIFHGFY